MKRTQLTAAIRLPAMAGLAFCLALGCISLTACTDNTAVDKKQTWTNPEELLGKADKPVIYLYPEETTDVSVSVGHPELITTEYPAYGDGWQVVASPDGTLTDKVTGRSLYALYYEAALNHPEDMTDEGFVVGRDEVVPFLEEKLATLGLTEREAEEMIVYWLPRMQETPWCYARFSLTDEEQADNPLHISPEPDHLIRIRMIWKGLDEPVDGIREQNLAPVDRNALEGFVAVEWGGTELGD